MAHVPAGPPDWREGYSDGCRTGRNAAGSIGDRFTRDHGRYASEAQYKQGWDDGFVICKSKWESY